MGVLLASITTAPPAGAAAPSVTLPVLPAVPVTAAGLTLTPTSPAGPAGFSVRVTILDAPTHVAVMLACVTAVIAFVLTVNVALVARQRDNGTARRRRGTKRDFTGAIRAARQCGRIQRHRSQRRD